MEWWLPTTRIWSRFVLWLITVLPYLLVDPCMMLTRGNRVITNRSEFFMRICMLLHPILPFPFPFCKHRARRRKIKVKEIKLSRLNSALPKRSFPIVASWFSCLPDKQLNTVFHPFCLPEAISVRNQHSLISNQANQVSENNLSKDFTIRPRWTGTLYWLNER